MKTIGIFLGMSNPVQFLHTTPYFHQAYIELSQAIHDEGGQMVLLGNQETYQGDGNFSKHWVMKKQNIVEKGSTQIDTVYNRGAFLTDPTLAIFNHPFLNSFCIDKWQTYQYFSKYCPLTFLIKNRQELRKKVQNISTDLIVAKPVDGSKGKDVFILSKTEILQHSFTFPILIQEFLDSSQGIPGIMQGTHDLRIAIINGEIAYCYYRTPPEGELIANVAQGGAFEMIPNEKIPKAALRIVKIVDKLFEKYPNRYYGVDVAFTSAGVKIIELNSKLGISIYAEGDVFKHLNQKLAKLLVEHQKAELS